MHDIYFSRQILPEFCTEHGSHTAVLCAKFHEDCSVMKIFMWKWDSDISVLDVFYGFAILWYLPAIIIAWIVTVCGPGDHSRSNDGESWTEILTAGHNLKCMLIYYGWDYTAQYSVEFIIALLQRSWKWGILFSYHPYLCPSIRLSICPSVCVQNRVHSVSSTILAGSFYIYTSCQATSEGVSHAMFFEKL